MCVDVPAAPDVFEVMQGCRLGGDRSVRSGGAGSCRLYLRSGAKELGFEVGALCISGVRVSSGQRELPPQSLLKSLIHLQILAHKGTLCATRRVGLAHLAAPGGPDVRTERSRRSKERRKEGHLLRGEAWSGGCAEAGIPGGGRPEPVLGTADAEAVGHHW